MNIETPRIYVACLASYNSGILHGVWIDAIDYDHVQDEINKMLGNSSEEVAEDYAIHDHEGFGSYSLHEYESIQEISEIAQLVSEHGEFFGDVLSYFGGDIDYCKKAFEEHYYGEYKSELDFAEYFFDEIHGHEVPESIGFYIDYEAYSRDIFINDFVAIDSGSSVHVFSCF